MSGTRKGVLKVQQTILQKKFNGDEEAMREWRRDMGRKGGQKGRTGGFHANPDIAREAGRKGGLKSRPKKYY